VTTLAAAKNREGLLIRQWGYFFVCHIIQCRSKAHRINIDLTGLQVSNVVITLSKHNPDNEMTIC
jgi:hypothetical protein